MSDERETIKGLGAKKAILKRLNASEEEIEGITSLEEANELIGFIQSEAKKNTASEPKMKKAGIPVLNTAPPSADQSREPISREELNDPLCPDVSRLNKLDQDGRILKLYSREYPSGRLV